MRTFGEDASVLKVREAVLAGGTLGAEQPVGRFGRRSAQVDFVRTHVRAFRTACEAGHVMTSCTV